MNNEIKEILDKWKCYIGLTKKFTINEYEMLRVEDIDKILDYITNLQQELEIMVKDDERSQETIIRLTKENEKLNEQLNDMTNISYKDYIVWETERHYLNILDEFANDIKYKIAPNLTDTYRDGIKLALKHTIKYVKDNYKQETLEDYKSRCDKAIEYIKEHIRIDDEYPDYMEMCIEERDDLLNILQNGSDK